MQNKIGAGVMAGTAHIPIKCPVVFSHAIVS